MPPFPWSKCTQYTVSEPCSAIQIRLSSAPGRVFRRRRRHAIISQKERHYFAEGTPLFRRRSTLCSRFEHRRCRRGVRYSTLGRYFDLNLLFAPQTLVMLFVVFTEVLTLRTYSLPERQYYWTNGLWSVVTRTVRLIRKPSYLTEFKAFECRISSRIGKVYNHNSCHKEATFFMNKSFELAVF